MSFEFVLYRCGCGTTPYSGRGGTGPRLRVAERHQALSYDAAPWPVASAPAQGPVFPRRQSGDARRGGRSLRPALQSLAHVAAEGGPGRVSQEPVGPAIDGYDATDRRWSTRGESALARRR